MSKNRYVNTSFWDDNYIRKLDPLGKLIFLHLLTSPLTNICGIYEVSTTRIAFDTGIDEDTVIRILKRFKGNGRIKYSRGYVAIRKFIEHQAKNSKIRKGIEVLLEKAPEGLVQWVEGYPIHSPSRDIDSSSHLNTNINFNYKKGDFEGITPDYVTELSKKYPGVDVSQEIYKMANWLSDNPKKKRQGKRSFINNWLKRANEDYKEIEEEGIPRLKQGNIKIE